MGIRTALRLSTYAAAIQAADHDDSGVQASLFDDPSSAPIASPWSDPGELGKLIASDVFGVDELPLASRTQAMRIPAVARGRNLIVSTVCRVPLRDYVRDQLAPVQPSWLTRTGDGSSPQLRDAWTADDLIFRGWSLWFKHELGVDRFPLSMGRINFDRWRIDDDSSLILIDEQPVDQSRCVLIPGLHEGILQYGVDTLRDARNLYDIVRNRLDMPVPNIDLHQTGGEPLSKEQRDDLIELWGAARKKRRGGVGYTSQHIEAKELGKGGEELMIEARNAASLDLARLIGVSAGLIDATVPKASLNYETTTGRNLEFIDRDVALYLTPVAARLSLDDVTPRGHRIAHDLSDFIEAAPSVSGPALED